MQDQVECFAGTGVKDALLGSKIGNTKSVDEGQNDAVERRQHLWRLTAANRAAIFTQSNIAPPVEPIFNLPVLADEVEQTLGRCEMRGKAGDAIDHFGTRALAAGNASLQLKDLGDITPLRGEIVVELATAA